MPVWKSAIETCMDILQRFCEFAGVLAQSFAAAQRELRRPVVPGTAATRAAGETCAASTMGGIRLTGNGTRMAIHARRW